MFPADYPYNQDISQVALDPGSATYIANLKTRAGAIVAEYPGDEYVNVVPQSQANVPVGTTAAYGFDTTDTFYQNNGSGAVAPIPSGVVYENMTNPNSDHHMIVVEQGTCRLFEMYAWNPSSATTGWEGLVTWNLTKNEQLPDGWGSTTAAGTPLLPGVIWYSEVAAGEIRHAVDIVIPGAAIAQYEYVKPAARSGSVWLGLSRGRLSLRRPPTPEGELRQLFVHGHASARRHRRPQEVRDAQHRRERRDTLFLPARGRNEARSDRHGAALEAHMGRLRGSDHVGRSEQSV